MLLKVKQVKTSVIGMLSHQPENELWLLGERVLVQPAQRRLQQARPVKGGDGAETQGRSLGRRNIFQCDEMESH